MSSWLKVWSRIRGSDHHAEGALAGYPQAARRRDRRLPYVTLVLSLGVTIATASYTHRMVVAQAASGGEIIDPVPSTLAIGLVLSLLLFFLSMARARAQESAHETEQRYDQLFNSTPIPMWVFDSESLMVRAANDAAVAQYGYSRQEFLALNILELRPPTEVPALMNVLSETPAALREAGVWTHRRKDGTLFEAEIAAHRIIFDGRPSMVVVANDVSERQRAQAAVQESEERLREVEAQFAHAQKMEAIGRLAGGIAHDFNNLLTVILGETEELSAVLPGDAEGAASVREIQQAGQRAATLTRQLLAFSRRQLIAPVVFDVNAAVLAMSSMCRRLIGEDIELVTRLAANSWTARADPGQIEQVLANLVVNARDAMPGGGRVTIETANVTLDEALASFLPGLRTGDYVVITVSDTGTGMTEEVRERLFEPFFTTKEPGKGTGLGLATCYGIMKQADGHLSVNSEPGLGTTIKAYLPRGVATGAAIEIVAPVILPRGSETILLVEDEPAVRRVAARVLKAQGYHLLEAGDGIEAARVTQEHQGEIHLLLTDVVLPGIGGREVAEQARAARPAIKVLFASGYTDDVILQRRLLHHDAVLLQKPFSRESIARKVREVLDAA
jgi:two-component system cell cycle sensor histidine kinase/response regulator CckA